MTAVIIDDEPHCRNVIARILETHALPVTVLAQCADGIEGLRAILTHRPDVVFLDIEMPNLNGFQMLEALGGDDLPFTLIFTTAYDRFAVRAFKYSAFEYLLKPIDDDELVGAVQKLQKRTTSAQQLQQLRDHLHPARPDIGKLTVAHARGLTFIDLADLIALEADGSYTRIYVTGREPILASRHLGYFDDFLTERPQFFRTHKQFIINLNYIKEYRHGDYNEVILQNGLVAKLARTRKEAFLALF